jgi:hypothetical protein
MIDYLNCLEILENSDNPFALATIAHLETQKPRQNLMRRFESKLRFIRSGYQSPPDCAVEFGSFADLRAGPGCDCPQKNRLKPNA